MNESELAIWLTRNHANVPLSGMNVYWEFGSWNVKGYIPIPDWGIIEVDFILNCDGWGNQYKGFDVRSDILLKFDANKPHVLGSVEKLPEIINNHLQPFLSFLENIDPPDIFSDEEVSKMLEDL